MLEPIFGNKTVEKALFFLRRYGQGYARGIAATFGLPLYSVQQQLKRLENGGVLASRLVGKSRVYVISPRYPFKIPLENLLDAAFKALTADEVNRYYMARTRPRRAGKP